nr:HAMP domain-containing sensor histidine kinase [Desulfuromonas acetoxidans]
MDGTGRCRELMRGFLMIETNFAPARRLTQEELASQLKVISDSEVVSVLLNSVGGLFAIVNEQRQVLSLNDKFIKMLGITDPYEFFGLRPGEVLHCIHSDEMPGGCGTSKSCSTCGAVLAMLSSLKTDQAAEETCALTMKAEQGCNELYLRIRSQPIRIEGYRLLFLFIQDITVDQQRAVLEKTFYHDINNLLNGLYGASNLLLRGKSIEKYSQVIHNLSERLIKEVEVQKMLSKHTAEASLQKTDVATDNLLAEIRSFYSHHPAAEKTHLEIVTSEQNVHVYSDVSLVMRVLCNMITNALEASTDNEVVKVWMSKVADRVIFHVHNNQVIPKNVQLRLFEKNFSTKTDEGRGLGTYSMKLIGEKLLGGKVRFISADPEGTTFTFSLPVMD